MEGIFDLIIIGAGPGGYTAAIKAAKLGMKTAVVEEQSVGGTCLNRGCIPAKAMLHAASVYQEAKRGEQFGVLAHGASYDYDGILAYKEDTTDQLRQGVLKLLEANGVRMLEGRGRLEKSYEKGRIVSVSRDGETEIYTADKVILAAGSKPLLLPIKGMDHAKVLTSDKIFQLTEVPESLLIIGGGVISVEFASVFAALDCQVTIVEAMPRLTPNLDKEISQNLKMILKKRGIDIYTSASVEYVEETADGMLACAFAEKEKEVKISSQYVLCAVGRCPDTDRLFGDGVEIEMQRRHIAVDEHFQTSIPDVYAIGDLVKGMQLAHAASAQGIAVAEELAGEERSIDLNVIPSCVYTDPEIASVGLTEEEAKEARISVRTGKFIMSANGKSLISKEDRGFVKIISETETGVIVGAQMMCGRATDMIGEFTTAVANKLTVRQMLRGMRPHPTYNEGVGEALEELMEGAIHVMPKKRR